MCPTSLSVSSIDLLSWVLVGESKTVGALYALLEVLSFDSDVVEGTGDGGASPNFENTSGVLVGVFSIASKLANGALEQTRAS